MATSGSRHARDISIDHSTDVEIDLTPPPALVGVDTGSMSDTISINTKREYVRPMWKLPAHHLVEAVKDAAELSKLSSRSRAFHEKQNEFVQDMQQLEALVDGRDGLDEDGEGKNQKQDAKHAIIAAWLSFAVNVVLLLLKTAVAVTSGSLAVMASAVDSFLDLFSGGILWYAARSAQNAKEEDYPAGASRAEPVGVIVFSAVMGMVALQIILEGIKRLILADNDSSFHLFDILAMSSAVVAKLGLYLYCRWVKSPAAHALSEDHRNDIITNSAGAVCAFIGARWAWWIDPLGAMLFSIFLIWSWSQTGLEYASYVVGKTAPPEFLQQITMISFNHNPDIIKIDTVRAFHFGSFYLVEVDIVLAPDTPLRASHDIGESLQNKLERIPQVERAFVHIDYEFTHKPEHSAKLTR